MLADIANVLRCTYCQQALDVESRTVRCKRGHSFDIARGGYLNLLPGDATSSTADTSEMVAARRAFLSAGHFEPIACALVGAIADADIDATDGIVLDAGAGTGYYLSAVLDAMPARLGLALDVSKRAAKVAARSHARGSAIVADVWGRLPLATSCAAAITCVFAPRNAEEFARVLAPGGVFVVVTPDPAHLSGIAEPLGLLSVDPRKSERLSAKLEGAFRLIAEKSLDCVMRLTREEALAAAEMGPVAAHATHEELAARVATLPDPASVRLAVTLRTYGLVGDRVPARQQADA